MRPGTAREILRERAEWYGLGRIEADGTTGDPGMLSAEFARWSADVSPIDGRTMNDRWLQFTHGSRHWHAPRHGDDDDVYVTYSVAEALDYAATELERMVEDKEDSAVAFAEEENYIAAWTSHVGAAKWHTLVANLRNMSAQHAAEPADRAPLYQDPETAPGRLAAALDHVIVNVRTEGPFGFNVYDCRHDFCRPRPDGEED